MKQQLYERALKRLETAYLNREMERTHLMLAENSDAIGAYARIDKARTLARASERELEKAMKEVFEDDIYGINT